VSEGKTSMETARFYRSRLRNHSPWVSHLSAFSFYMLFVAHRSRDTYSDTCPDFFDRIISTFF